MVAIEQMTENLGVRQRPTEGFRRWFINRFFDLILWYDHQGGTLTGFQLCLSRGYNERAFTWTTTYVSSHRVSGPDLTTGLSRLGTGILKDDGGLISSDELARFEAESQNVDPALRTLIVQKIRDYQLRAVA